MSERERTAVILTLGARLLARSRKWRNRLVEQEALAGLAALLLRDVGFAQKDLIT